MGLVFTHKFKKKLFCFALVFLLFFLSGFVLFCFVLFCFVFYWLESEWEKSIHWNIIGATVLYYM